MKGEKKPGVFYKLLVSPFGNEDGVVNPIRSKSKLSSLLGRKSGSLELVSNAKP